MNYNIICLKWGDKYGPHYVNRLYNQCQKFINVPFTFYCVTDNNEGLNPNIHTLDITPFSAKEGSWGGKVFTFEKISVLSSNTFNEKGKCILFDLDILILNDLTKYLKSLNTRKPVFINNSWSDPKNIAKNYGKITCHINSSFIVSNKNMFPVYRKINSHYDYFSMKFSSLDRTINYNCMDLISFHDDNIVYAYSFGAKHPDDMEPYKRRDDYKLCLFNTSHGRGVELEDATGWAKDYWESFDGS